MLPDLVTPDIMFERLKDELVEEDEDGGLNRDGVDKYMKDLTQMMDGMLDLNRRNQLPDRERAICLKLLLRITLKVMEAWWCHCDCDCDCCRFRCPYIYLSHDCCCHYCCCPFIYLIVFPLFFVVIYDCVQEDVFDEVERDSAQEWLAAIEGTRSRRNRQVGMVPGPRSKILDEAILI